MFIYTLEVFNKNALTRSGTGTFNPLKLVGQFFYRLVPMTTEPFNPTRYIWYFYSIEPVRWKQMIDLRPSVWSNVRQKRVAETRRNARSDFSRTRRYSRKIVVYSFQSALSRGRNSVFWIIAFRFRYRIIRKITAHKRIAIRRTTPQHADIVARHTWPYTRGDPSLA